MEKNDTQFTNFKIHSQYSICEGAVKIDELAEHCKKNKNNAEETDLEIIAKKLFNKGKIGSWKRIYSHYYGTEQNDSIKKSNQKK